MKRRSHRGGQVGQLVVPVSAPPSSTDTPLILTSPIIIWCRRDSVEEHEGEFAGLILPGGLVRPLNFGLLSNSTVALWSMSVFPLKIHSWRNSKADSGDITALALMCVTP